MFKRLMRQGKVASARTPGFVRRFGSCATIFLLSYILTGIRPIGAHFLRCYDRSVLKYIVGGEPAECEDDAKHERRIVMGKYFIAWLLGVPAFVLVLIYLIF